MVKSVLDYLENSVRKHPQKKCVVDLEGSYTYKEIEEYAQRVGSYLLGKEWEAGSVVIVMLGKCKEAMAAFWGITYAGGIYAPIDCNAPSERLIKIVNVLQPKYVLTNIENKNKAKLIFDEEKIICLESIKEGRIDLERLEETRKKQIDADPAYIICTSGSTGTPKGVVISHRSIIDFVEEASEVMHLSEKDSFANQAPFYFDASVPDLYCTIRNGATLHIIPEKWFAFPIKVLEYIRDNGINAIFWVPSALIVTANLRALKEVDVTCLDKIMFCGEVMPVKQLNMWRKYVPNAIYVNYYGPSETTYASTYYIIDREFSENEILPIGKAAVNTDILILNEEENECLKGETGELYIRGAGVSLGYYNNVEKTREVFIQNPLIKNYRDIVYKTGDLVRINKNDEIEYVGRKDFQIKYMGYRIELGEIESAAIISNGIQRTCCAYQNEKIVLFYQGDISEEELEDTLKERLPEYMIPKVFCKMDNLPMNANGKIDRVYLNGLAKEM